jgi:hypothetical protein
MQKIIYGALFAAISKERRATPAAERVGLQAPPYATENVNIQRIMQFLALLFLH